MAIGTDSIVAVKVSSTQLTIGFICSQPPAFGKNESGSSPFTVTWANNGNRVASIPGDLLDEITDPSVDTEALLGQLVTVAGSASAYTSLVVGAYARSGVDVLLLKTLSGEAYREILPANVVPAPG
jgi:hypothetical protein